MQYIRSYAILRITNRTNNSLLIAKSRNISKNLKVGAFHK